MISEPASASPTAIPLPIPLVAPVTIAVLPFREKRDEDIGKLATERLVNGGCIGIPAPDFP